MNNLLDIEEQHNCLVFKDSGFDTNVTKLYYKKYKPQPPGYYEDEQRVESKWNLSKQTKMF